MRSLPTKMTWTAVVVASLSLAAVEAAAQQDTSSQGPVPAATGPDTKTDIIENPPLSGLDEPSFEPGLGARSYLLPKVQISDAVDSNPYGTLGARSGLKDVARGLGSLTLQKLWKVHPLDVEYIGGVAHYFGSSGKIYQIHSLGATQRFLWRTGQLAIRDDFSYLPLGSFGFNSFGGAGGVNGGGGIGGLGGGGITGGGVAGGGGGGVFTAGQIGSLGNQPRITQMGIVDITQSLSPRSALVLSGGFGVTDFINAPAGYINSQQVIGQVGYSRQMSRRDQIALMYAYQAFHFPRTNSGTFNVDVWQVLYGHRITGRLDFKLGGGPQWVHRNSFFLVAPPRPLNPTGVWIPDNRSYVSGAGLVSLHYYVSARTDLTLHYSHYANAGSGFFAGANTDLMRFAVNHSFKQHWSTIEDVGYSRNSRILANPSSLVHNAATYNYWYAGASVRRQFGRHYGAFASYQYDAIHFGSGLCTSANLSCNRLGGRNVGLVGVDWTPRPIRLD